VRTARYRNLVTPKPDAVSDAELALSLLPVGCVLLWPWLRMLAGEINALEAFFDWRSRPLGVGECGRGTRPTPRDTCPP